MSIKSDLWLRRMAEEHEMIAPFLPELLREVKLPLRCPTMMAFGGADLRTLYITSAGAKRPAAERARYPLSGCVLALRVEVAGVPERVYLP